MDNSPFNKLSAELRNEIYALSLRQDQAVNITIDSTTDKLTTRVKYATALTQTCKQIYQECSSMFYALNNFVISEYIDSNTKPHHEPDGEEETSEVDNTVEGEGISEEEEASEDEEMSEIDILERSLSTIGPKHCAALSHLVVQVHRQTKDQDKTRRLPELRDLPEIAEEFKPSHLAVQISLENAARQTVSAGFNVLDYCKSLTEAARELLGDFQVIDPALPLGILVGDLVSILKDLKRWERRAKMETPDFSREVADVVPWD